MSEFTVVVSGKAKFPDHQGEGIRKEWAAAGLKGLKAVRSCQAYALSGLSEADARRLAEALLADPVTQEAGVHPAGAAKAPAGARRARVWPKPGVADPVADTVALAARDLGIASLSSARSGQVYDFVGSVSPEDVRRFCEDHLMNALVQRVEVS